MTVSEAVALRSRLNDKETADTAFEQLLTCLLYTSCNVNLLRILHSGISYIALAAAKSLPASFLICFTGT